MRFSIRFSSFFVDFISRHIFIYSANSERELYKIAVDLYSLFCVLLPLVFVRSFARFQLSHLTVVKADELVLLWFYCLHRNKHSTLLFCGQYLSWLKFNLTIILFTFVTWRLYVLFSVAQILYLLHAKLIWMCWQMAFSWPHQKLMTRTLSKWLWINELFIS